MKFGVLQVKAYHVKLANTVKVDYHLLTYAIHPQGVRVGSFPVLAHYEHSVFCPTYLETHKEKMRLEGKLEGDQMQQKLQ